MTAAPSKLEAGREVETEKDRGLRAYRQMVRIRLFEEQVNELYTRALMPGLAHLYSGEEAVAVGICEALHIDDYITSTHRGHGHCLAKGASPDRMFAELLGKEAGYCRGKGGSMHIADPATGNLGANAIVGGSVGIATGAAFAAKRLGNGRVAICFFGEGALGQGSLYEVMNLAQLWKLPVIYVCENNLYNEYTHFSETTAGTILGRAAAFGIEAASVDGQDVRAVSEVALQLVKRARGGEGPAFLQADTYRYSGHHVGEDGETHAGLYDIAYMLAVPNMTVTAPKNGHEMLGLLRAAVHHESGPFTLRYPRDAAPDLPPAMREIEAVPYRTWEVLRRGTPAEVAILAVGTMVLPSVAAAEMLASEGLSVTVVNCRYLKPYDELTLAAVVADHRHLLVVEEGTVVNGFGAYMASVVASMDPAVRVVAHGVPDRIIYAAPRARQLALCGLDAAGIAERVRALHGSEAVTG